MKLRLLAEKLQNGEFNQRLSEVYVLDEVGVGVGVQRYLQALQGFESQFGNQDVAIYSAPGRTEVGGNHTDHQHGKVLAAAVNMDAIAVVSNTSNNEITIISAGYDIPVIEITDLTVKPEQKFTTASLITGVSARFKELGYKVGGFNAYCTSSVLKGSGISSSAAFEVLIGVILNHEFNEGKITAIEIAQIAQYAENVYFGKPCGLMDQMASSVGGFVFIDFKNVNQPLVEKVDFDISASGYTLCLVDTGGNHADLSDEYGKMVSEMKAVAKFFDCEFLIDVNPNDFYRNIANIRQICGDRAIIRAIHFFNDDARVISLVNSLQTKDLAGFFKIVNASGDSSYKYLQNVFCVNTPTEQGLSIALALSEKILINQGAYRVHGGGLAGTIQAYIPNDLVAQYIETLEAVFGEGSYHILAIRPFGGILVIS